MGHSAIQQELVHFKKNYIKIISMMTLHIITIHDNNLDNQPMGQTEPQGLFLRSGFAMGQYDTPVSSILRPTPTSVILYLLHFLLMASAPRSTPTLTVTSAPTSTVRDRPPWPAPWATSRTALGTTSPITRSWTWPWSWSWVWPGIRTEYNMEFHKILLLKSFTAKSLWGKHRRLS